MPTLLRALDGESIQLFNSGNANKISLSVTNTTLGFTLDGDASPFMSINKGSVSFSNDTAVSGNTSFSNNVSVSGLLTLKGQADTGSSSYGMVSDVALSIEHATAGGSSTIYFKSAQNSPSDFGYIKFKDTTGAAGTEIAQLMIGIENDGSAPDSIMLKGYTIINSDSFSSDYTRIVTFQSASTEKSYIDTAGDYYKGSTKVSYEGHTHVKANITDFGTYDNYQNWLLKAPSSDATGTTISSQKSVIITGSGATSVSKSVDANGNATVTISSTDTNTTYGVVTATTDGLAPKFNATDTTKFLRADATWAVPPDTNTTYSSGDGLVLTSTTFSAGITDGLEFDTSTPKKIRVKLQSGTAGSIGTVNRTTNGLGVDLGNTGTTACAGNDARLSDSRTPKAHGDEAHNNMAAIRITFGAGKSTYTWTHNKNWTDYIVQITPNSPETHYYYSSKSANSIIISLDDSAYDSIDLDVVIINLSSIATATA